MSKSDPKVGNVFKVGDLVQFTTEALMATRHRNLYGVHQVVGFKGPTLQGEYNTLLRHPLGVSGKRFERRSAMESDLELAIPRTEFEASRWAKMFPPAQPKPPKAPAGVASITLGERQASAIEIYVADPAHDDDDERPPVEYDPASNRLSWKSEDTEIVASRLTDILNGLDDQAEGMVPSIDAEGRAQARIDRDALTALVRRVRQSRPAGGKRRHAVGAVTAAAFARAMKAKRIR